MSKQKTLVSQQKKEKGIYRSLWLLCIYDLPMEENHERRAYNRFLRKLKQLGFMRLQKSCYAHHFFAESEIAPFIKKIFTYIPATGSVRFITVSDVAFAKQMVFANKAKKYVESQVSLFDYV